MQNKISDPILITGASGFIGANLTRHLIHNYNVHIFIRKNSDLWRIHDIIDHAIHAVEELTDAKIEWSIPNASPGLINDRSCADLVINSAKSILGDENVVTMKESSMGGEDFAYYLAKIPGAYFRIGCNDGKTRDIHTNDFNLDVRCIATAI